MKNVFKTLMVMALVCMSSVSARAYTINGNSATFASGEKITIVLPENANQFGFQQNGVFAASGKLENEVGGGDHRKCYVITTNAGTISSGGNNVFHWEKKTGESSYTWQHSGTEWLKFSAAAASATSSFPIPNETGYVTILVTEDGSGKTVITWSKDAIAGGVAPTPTPGGSSVGTAGESGTSAGEQATAEGNGVIGDRVACGDCYSVAF